MFPSDKRFNVFGNPSFEDPTTHYPNFGKDLEDVVAKQEIKFGETGLFPPRMFPDCDNTHFEYRIYKGRTTSSEYEPIHFDYFPNERTLRVHSAIPEFRICPIVDFIAKHYLKVHLIEVTPKKENVPKIRTYDNPIANEIINDPGCELFNDTERMRLTGESILSLCEKLSNKPLDKKEFAEVSRDPSLYPYWVMAEGVREIREIWKLTQFYIGKVDSIPKGIKFVSYYMNWDCEYSFWQAIDKFYRSAIQRNINYNDTDIMIIHYLGIVYGKSIKLINNHYGYWLEFDLKKLGDHLYAILERKTDKKEFGTLVIKQLEVIKKWVDILHNELPIYETARLRGENPKDDSLAKKVITEIRKQPINARLVDVTPSAGKGLRTALKDPGGRPKKTSGGAKVTTQAEMAVAFGAPCNESMVANWEARAAGKKRGANPPDAIYNGERIIYSAELRTNPTPDNEKRLTALIAEFQSRHRIKEAIGEKALHMKSPETLAKASGQIGAAIRERSQLKYEK